jgi:hypothetical protein
MPKEPLDSFLLPSRSRVCTFLLALFRRTALEKTNNVGLVLAAFKDLDHAFVLVGCAELVLQSGLAGSVQDTLSAVANTLLERVYIAGLTETYEWVMKIFQPFKTSARGMLRSFFHFFRISSSSTKTTKSSDLPL